MTTLFFVMLLPIRWAIAQQNEIIPNLSEVNDTNLWHLSDREIIGVDPIHLGRGDGDGVLWFKNLNFKNGTIDLDIKGCDIRGESFVGLALHGLDRNNFEVIYFRPFNFKSEEKKGNSVQYVSLPDYGWRRLREEHPGVYESEPIPVPDPNEWFHVTIDVDHPTVKVFLNNSEKASLTVEQLSARKEGWVGFWVGSYSEGEFKNLKIKKK